MKNGEGCMDIKKYKVIYADPPWSYRNKRTGGSMRSGAASKYPVMTVDEICSLPVADIADKDAVLFLWATVPMLPEALQVMKAWGFAYKTMLTWRKIMSLGMGFWFRCQTEHLLVGVRGKVRAFRCQKPNFMQLRALGHSEKPEEFRKLIEEVTAGMEPRIELFARKYSLGWDVWGNEVDGVDIFAIQKVLKEGKRVGH